MNKYTINDITRASGGFAMLAVDQREAMRDCQKLRHDCRRR